MYYNFTGLVIPAERNCFYTNLEDVQHFSSEVVICCWGHQQTGNRCIKTTVTSVPYSNVDGSTRIAHSLSLLSDGHFSIWTWVSRYQNVSILAFIGAKDDGGGGDNWSYKTCKALESKFHHQQLLPTEYNTITKSKSAYKEIIHYKLQLSKHFLNCNTLSKVFRKHHSFFLLMCM